MSETLTYPFENAGPIEPPPEWAELRAQCPVAKVQLGGGTEAHLLTRYDDVRSLLSDDRFERNMPEGAASRADVGVLAEGTGVVSAVADKESHLAWRRLLQATFTAKRVQALVPAITAKATELLDAMLAGGSPADLVKSFSYPLPVWVICELLGVPDADRDKFGPWSDAYLSLSRFTDEEVATARAELAAYVVGQVEAKRANPGDDLMSELIALVDANDPRMTGEMMVGTTIALLVAGHETTASHIAKMMALLLGDRSRWEQLVADPSLVRTAVEESLRFDPNAGFGMVRYVTEDTEYSGTTVPAESMVVCSLASANRDESAFDDAATMDLDRRPNPHLSFGAGMHSCLGQALARTELNVVLELLVRKVPTLELAAPLESVPRKVGLLVSGFEELPVTW